MEAERVLFGDNFQSLGRAWTSIGDDVFCAGRECSGCEEELHSTKGINIGTDAPRSKKMNSQKVQNNVTPA
jgi:hypothetical protein